MCIIISVMTYNLSAEKFDLITRSQVITQVKAMLARDKADKAKAHALYRKAKARK